jgi:hypothetical protein
MTYKENVADWYSATYHKDAGTASILEHCSTNLKGDLLCDTKGGAC